MKKLSYEIKGGYLLVEGALKRDVVRQLASQFYLREKAFLRLGSKKWQFKSKTE